MIADPARFATFGLLAVALVMGAAAVTLAGRATGRAPGHSAFRPLPGVALVVAGGLLVARDAAAAGLALEGVLPPAARAAFIAAGAGALVAALLLLNAFAEPRGLAPSWVLILSAPVLYLLVAVPVAWAAEGSLPLAGAWQVAVPVVAGALTGAYLFLAVLVFRRAPGKGVRRAVALLAGAAALQGVAAAALAASPSEAAMLHLALADAATTAVFAAAVVAAGGGGKRDRNVPTVTITP